MLRKGFIFKNNKLNKEIFKLNSYFFDSFSHFLDAAALTNLRLSAWQ